MPKIFETNGYKVYFWSNEQDPLEPVHVHVSKTVRQHATKIWLLSNGQTEVANNSSRILEKDLTQIRKIISNYHDVIVSSWEAFFKCSATFIK